MSKGCRSRRRRRWLVETVELARALCAATWLNGGRSRGKRIELFAQLQLSARQEFARFAGKRIAQRLARIAILA